MTVNFNETVGFQNLSAINYHSKSCTGQANELFGGWSFTAGFQKGTSAGGTGNYRINPNTANANDVRNALCTLIVDLYEKKVI